jgi:hypothetical protein
MAHKLDFTNIPKNEFTLSKCIEILESDVRDYGEYPDSIIITEYQQGVMSSIVFGPWKMWRGIPLELVDQVKDSLEGK